MEVFQTNRPVSMQETQYKKLEEERLEKERKLNEQRMAFESEIRKEEREHEMNMLRLSMGSQPSPALQDIHPQFVPSAVSYNNTSGSHCSDTESNSFVYYQL